MAEPSKKFTFKNESGEELAGRLELPSGNPKATAVFAHCFTCSKDIAAASRISRALALRGFAVLRFDFTGLGNSEGDFENTNFSSNVEDLICAAQAMRSELGSVDLLIGHSLGGAAVLAAASKLNEVKAVATIAAPSEVTHVKGLFQESLDKIEENGIAKVNLAGRDFNIKKQFVTDLEKNKIIDLLPNLRKALLIFHSPIDNLVGIEHAKNIFMAAKHPKSFVSLDQADHLLSNKLDSEYVAEVLGSWASRYVGVLEERKLTNQSPSSAQVIIEEKSPPYTQKVMAGRHYLIADEPTSVKGGRDFGPNPYDYLLIALGSCTSMTIRMYADHKKWPLEHVSVALSTKKIHAKDCEECETKEGSLDQITREITFKGDLTEEQAARISEIADKCPVHKTLKGEVSIKTESRHER